ncbi:hypothetical protein GOP47_0004663 [Adiantum capillus-veneris]|uniref:Uncharacterized protein n=1 Tax=Adiantum capillus-veneris TaxID=13818 RepID=A0A9D4V7U6_ADICA|nr:hypothetical protein GOP47_0004663 [Adiantum capillus-veneris]
MVHLVTALQHIINSYLPRKHAPLLCTAVGRKDRSQKILKNGRDRDARVGYTHKAIEEDGKHEDNVVVYQLQASALHSIITNEAIFAFSKPISLKYINGSRGNKETPPTIVDIFTDTGPNITTIGQHNNRVFALAVAGDLLYSASASTGIRVFKAPLFEELDRFGSGYGMVKALMTFGDKLYSAHQDNKIRVWKRVGNSDTTCKHKLLAVLPRLDHVLKSMVLERKYVQVRRHKKKLWMEHADTISALAMGGDKCSSKGNSVQSCTPSVLYSASWDKTVKVWSLNTCNCIESFHAHNDAINAMIVIDGFVLVTASADCSIKLWMQRGFSGKKRKHSLLTTLHGQRAAVNALAASANGRILYSGSSDGAMIAWKRVSYKPQPRVSYSYSSDNGDGHLKAGEMDIGLGEAKVDWLARDDSSTATVLRMYESGSLAGLRRMSQDNTRAVASAGVSFVMRKVMVGHTRAVLSVSTVGNDIVCSSSADKTIRVWKREAGDRPKQRRSNDYGDGAHEAKTSTWEYKCLSVLAGHGGPVKSIASVLCPASPPHHVLTYDCSIDVAGDGDRAHRDAGVVVYSGGLDSKVKAWYLPLQRFICPQ